MSSPAPLDALSAPAAASAKEPPPLDGWSPEPDGLAALRAELDHLDDVLHDTLMKRAAVIERVAKSGKSSAYRPGREAAIIRRLLARHSGNLPPHVLVRVWRELLAGTTAMQGGLSVAVCQTDAAAGFIQVAREHFGALTPVHVHRSSAQAIAEVSAGTASVAVLPMPSETEPPRAAWWTALLHRDSPRIHVVGRLPFWARRPEGAPGVQALVIAPAAPDPSGRDRSLLGLELDLDVSRARLTAAVTASGMVSGTVILRRDAGAQVAHALVEVEGYVAEDDVRLVGIATVHRPPVVLGAYAVPEEGGAA
jgi:chorismate mutase / prephenate dehydratase